MSTEQVLRVYRLYATVLRQQAAVVPSSVAVVVEVVVVVVIVVVVMVVVMSDVFSLTHVFRPLPAAAAIGTAARATD